MASVNGTLAIAALVALVAVAALNDVRERRIPNVLVFLGAVLGLAWRASDGGLAAALLALAGWVVGLLLFLPFHALRAMGAGDVKLVAMVGAWVGPRDVVTVALLAMIVGGVLALAVAARRGTTRQAFANAGRVLLHAGAPRDAHGRARRTTGDLPYGVAIAAGTLVHLAGVRIV